MPMQLRNRAFAGVLCVLFAKSVSSASSDSITTKTSYLVCVSNERGDSVTLIDGAKAQTSGAAAVITTIPVGKRPRGIEASPDGTKLYVALSGSPIMGPPQLDSQGNPIEKEVDESQIDHSKDGIGVIDLKERKFIKKIPAGSDPEEFAVTSKPLRLYIANEDVGTVSVMDPAIETIEAIIPVEEEPEGVTLSPDEKRVYITCETRGEVFVVDTTTNKPVGQFLVDGRPRSTAFTPDGSKAFVPSESSGKIHVIDTGTLKIEKIIKLPPGSRPMGLLMSPDASVLYASTGRGGTVVSIDANKLTVTETIKAGTRPWGIGISPDGKLLFTANGPSNDVSVIDTAAGKEIARIPCGASPWGIEVVANPE